MSDAMMDGLSAGELATVVELQRVELDRLLREHRRLNDRIDQMLRLQEREQVLRQQMQAALDRLAEQRVSSGTNLERPAEPRQLADRLHRTERRFSALSSAVGQLVSYIEQKERAVKSTEPAKNTPKSVRLAFPAAPGA